MVDEEKPKEQPRDEEKDEEKDESEEIEKSFHEAVKSNFDTLTDVIQSLAETQKSNGEMIADISERVKALETPTDLPLKPKTEDKEDVGADVTVPDEYQSNSIQAGLDDDKSGAKKPESDDSGLKMQEKAEFNFTTETPRPNASIDTVNKSSGTDISYVLKDSREVGHDGLSQVARDILKGKYYQPSPDEVGAY